MNKMPMVLRPIELKDANEFVAKFHRHHIPVQGHRFSLSAWKNNVLVGVAICGRPVSRNYDSLEVLEVTRLCTDGMKNACSFLYGACASSARSLGYKRIQTYILSNELGTSLKASGWKCEGEAGGGQWPSREQPSLFTYEEITGQPTEVKIRWAKVFGVQ